jgi:hypothetical protein
LKQSVVTRRATWTVSKKKVSNFAVMPQEIEMSFGHAAKKRLLNEGYFE